MIFINRPATRLVAVCLGLALMQAYVLATPAVPPRSGKTARPQTAGQSVGRLITRGGKTITVNGQVVGNGATILTDSTIQTPGDVGATIVLSNLATVEIGPNTELVLDFSSGKLSLKILRGCVRTRARKGVDYSETTQTGEPVQRRGKGTVCVGVAGSSPGAEQVGAGGAFGHTALVLSLVGGTAAAVTAGIIIMQNNNNNNNNTVSPIR
jgi:hypothetical protein